MAIPTKRIEGFVLVLIVLVSAYLTVVQLVNAFQPMNLLKTFNATDLRRNNMDGKFVINDAFVAKVECGRVNAYRLEFYSSESLVLEKYGSVSASPFNVCVPLVPPTFKAKSEYIAFLYVYAFNDPLPGIFFTDSESFIFETTQAETRLSLTCGYNATFRNLYLRANLTDVEGWPVANETVDFSLQFSNRHRVTDGWYPVGSARTNASGIAELDSALNVPWGNYSARARNRGNENYAESESITSLEVSPDSGCGDSVFFAQHGSSSWNGPSTADIIGLSMEASCYSPYTTLPLKVYVNCTTDAPVLDACRVAIFKLDNLTSGRLLGACGLQFFSGGPPYVYNATLDWAPNVTDFHRIVAGIFFGDLEGFFKAAENGTGIIVFAETGFNFRLCPSNTVLHVPEVVYDDHLPVYVAVSKPRQYEEKVSDGLAAYSLAPKFSQAGIDYVADDPVESIPVVLYANETRKASGFTNSSGLVALASVLGIYGQHFRLNLTVEVNGTDFLYEGRSVWREVFFTKVNVSSVASGGSSHFVADCPLGNGEGEEDPVYVQAERQVEVNVKLFNSPVLFAPVSVLIGKPLARNYSDSSGRIWIPAQASLVRVVCMYDINSTTGIPTRDIIRNGKVDLADVYAAGKAFGSIPIDSKWDLRADTNLDLKVDLKDYFHVCRGFGKGAFNYTEVESFGCGLKAILYGRYGGKVGEVYSDRWGCIDISSYSAVTLKLEFNGHLTGALVEFFRCTFHEGSYTDNVGSVGLSWKPEETGAKGLPVYGGLWPYLLEWWILPCSHVLACQGADVTSVKAVLGFGRYLDVVKRPIDVSVEFSPDEPTLDDVVTISATCFDRGLGESPEGWYVDFLLYGKTMPFGELVWVYIGWNVTDSFGVARLSFVSRVYYENANFLPYFYGVAASLETNRTLYSEAHVLIDTRYPTKLEHLGEDAIQVPVGKAVDVSCRLVRADNGVPVVGRLVQLFVNDTLLGNDLTNENGIFGGSVTIYESGLYFFRAQFSWGEGFIDSLYEDSNNVTFVVAATVVPVFVLFEIEPKEFRPGATITLKATVYNATSKEPLQGFEVRFFKCNEAREVEFVNSGYTNASGVASTTWVYLMHGVYVFWACVSGTRQIISSPVVLTVGKETELLMDIQPCESYNFTVSGRLLCDGQPVPNKQIAIKANGTLLGALLTATDGTYSGKLYLPAKGNKPTDYQVEAVFNGDNTLNLTGNVKTPDGNTYAVCTTIHYFGYKPSANVTMLIVEPQAAHVARATKTPEQLQQEAQQDGWFSIWHEFSWSYPWYRVHIQTSVNPRIHIGFNPLLPGGEIADWERLEVFGMIVGEVVQEIIVDIVGLFAGYFAAKVLSIWNPAIGIIAEAIKGSLQFALLVAYEWNDKTGLLVSSIVSFIMGFVALNVEIGKAFIQALCSWTSGAASAALTDLHWKLLHVLFVTQFTGRWWLDYVDAAINWVIGGIALIRYLTMG